MSFLTQEETKRLFAVIPTKRDHALFLTAYHHDCRQRASIYTGSFFVGGLDEGTVMGRKLDS